MQPEYAHMHCLDMTFQDDSMTARQHLGLLDLAMRMLQEVVTKYRYTSSHACIL